MIGIKIYLTDCNLIYRALRKRLNLELKDGIYQKRTDGCKIKLLLIEREELCANHLPYADVFSAYAGSQITTFYNAFEPTADGQTAFQMLQQAAGLEKSVVLTCDVRTMSGSLRQGKSCRLHGSFETFQLKKWTETRIQSAVTAGAGRWCCDYKVLPVLAQIEKRRSEITERDFTHKTFGKFQAGNTVFSAELVESAGSKRKECFRDIPGKIVEIEKRKKEVPPLPFSYLELIEAADNAGIPVLSALEMMEHFYESGLITYPKTSEQNLRPEIIEKMLLPMHMQLDVYKEYAEKVKYRQLPKEMIKEADTAGGIVLLQNEKLADRYENPDEKPLLDLLIRRQLNLFSAPAKEEELIITIKAAGEFFQTKVTCLIESGWKEIAEGEMPCGEALYIGQEVILKEVEQRIVIPELHTVSSLIRLLKIYAAGTDLEIAEIIESLEKNPLIDKIGRFYLLKQDGIELISRIPQKMKDMDEINKAYRYVKQKVEIERMEKAAYRNWVNDVVQEL